MLTNRLTGTTEATATTATNTQILRPAYPPLPATSGHNPKANLLAIPIRPRRRRPVADKQFLGTNGAVSTWISKQPGFISRELVYEGEGNRWVDVHLVGDHGAGPRRQRAVDDLGVVSTDVRV